MTYGSPVAFDDAVKLTQYAVSRGVNLIDTANMYEGYNRYAGSAGGVAEEIVGRAVRAACRTAAVAVATKVGMKVGPRAREDEGTSPRSHPQAAGQEPCAPRHGLQSTLYYLHRPDESVPLADILGALSDAQRAGKIRYYGVEQLLRRAARPPFCARRTRRTCHAPVACQPPLSYLKQEALAALLPLCAAEGHRGHPLPDLPRGGLLTGQIPPRRRRAPPGPARGREAGMDDAHGTTRCSTAIESFAAARAGARQEHGAVRHPLDARAAGGRLRHRGREEREAGGRRRRGARMTEGPP